MKAKSKQSGLTLTEMTVVVASIVLLAVIGLPAVRAFIHSFETESSTKSMVGAALASARAIAVREQRYAGIRFQKAYQSEGLLNAPQYMIFIVWEEPKKMDGLTVGFRAVEGLKPIKLPDTIGVMDLKIVTNRDDSSSYKEIQLDDPTLPAAVADGWINESRELTDTTTFSIIFSPSGKMVVHRVQVRNRNGIPDTKAEPGNTSYDDVFNKKGDVDKRSPELVLMGMGNEIGMFYQDDYFGVLDTPNYPGLGSYPDLGLGPEYSRNSFIIYDTKEFTQAYQRKQAWSDYLNQAKPIYINPYTGTIISLD